MFTDQLAAVLEKLAAVLLQIHLIASVQAAGGTKPLSPALETIEAANKWQNRAIVEITRAHITAYTSDPAETDDTPTITASGTSTRPGIAACPRRYVFGTIIVIDGEEFDCQDRLSLKYDDRFDIWKQSKEEAFQWGIRTKDVIIVK